MSAGKVLRALGELPEPDVHCIQLAIKTLRRAMADYPNQESALCQKNYRKI